MLVRYRHPRFVSPRRDVEFNRLVSRALGEPTRFAPATDIATEGNDVVITLDVPGVAVADLDVTVEDRRLVVSGKREAAQVADSDRVIARGSARGEFTRAFPLPAHVTADQISAKVDNGILTVRVSDVTAPRPEPRRIEITDAQDSAQVEVGTDN